MRGYGQFCPVAKAAEIVAERWTPLVLRELLAGSRRFNDVRRGVPLMSPALLAKRLRKLEDAGIVERQAVGRALEYRLTKAGEELAPLIQFLGEWGQRWARSRFDRADLDPVLLMWDLRRNVKPDAFPGPRVVVRFEFTDAPRAERLWWVINEAGAADPCLTDPGFEVDLYVTTDLRTLAMVWMGDRSLADALAADDIEIIGPRALQRAFGAWLGLSRFAGIRDQRPAGAA
jgi:DNA-binding HxlR family transcriptional regulator